MLLMFYVIVLEGFLERNGNLIRKIKIHGLDFFENYPRTGIRHVSHRTSMLEGGPGMTIFGSVYINAACPLKGFGSLNGMS